MMTLRELIDKVGDEALDYELSMTIWFSSIDTFLIEPVTDFDVGYSDKIIKLS
jgi:hypothetical protein